MSNKSKTIVTLQEFQAIPGLTHTDRTILSFVKNLSKGGFVSVSYIANMIGMTRESVSRTLTKLKKAGWLGYMELNRRKSLYVLTKETLDIVSRYVKHQAEALAAKVKETSDELKERNKQKAMEKAAFEQATEADQAAEPTKNRRALLMEYFWPMWEKSGLPQEMFIDNLMDYFDYCESKGAYPSRDGLRKRLEARAVSALDGIKSREQTEAFNDVKRQKLSAMIKRNELLTDQYDSENINMAFG